MEFAVGDKVVHPHHGPGQITSVEHRELLDGKKRYYVIDIPAMELTVRVPWRKVDHLGVRPAMSRAKVARMLDTLGSKPSQLPQDHKERQAGVWEKIRTSRPIPTAEAVRDLTWRSQQAHLTKKDSELLQRGLDFLAAEMALVSDCKVSEATIRIESALARAMAARMESELPQQLL
ncbi:MAG: CarD family transcriptional regulator [Anaerolineae bacterium]|jgi:CarD family transcriptional regulator